MTDAKVKVVSYVKQYTSKQDTNIMTKLENFQKIKVGGTSLFRVKGPRSPIQSAQILRAWGYNYV